MLRATTAAPSYFDASYWRARPALAFAILAAVITALRILALIFADANLGPDEAQYWVWSKTPDFGYYSKPPLIAWAIGATTAVFGDGEWAVRLSSPLFHLGTAIFLFALARRLYGEAIAFWVGAGWLTLPGAAFSATLITTDAPLLFFWSAALYFFFRVLRAETPSQSLRAAALLGAAFGLGMLSKYAMIYFLAGVVGAYAAAPSVRMRLGWKEALLALVVAGAMMTPNVLWNARHDFQTISHTAANAHWSADLFHPGELGEFLAAQFGVFGPALFALFIWGAASLPKRLREAGVRRDDDLSLFALAIPPLTIVCVQAFIARAHANWAAAAYPAALLLVVMWAFRAKLGFIIRASVAAHLFIGLGFLAIYSNFALADAVGLSNSVKRVREWQAQGEYVKAHSVGYDAIIVDDRELMGSLLYYARSAAPILAWNSNGRIDDHYEAFMAYDAARFPHALFVTAHPEAIALQRRFASITPAGEITVDLKRGRKRTLYLFDASGYQEKR